MTANQWQQGSILTLEIVDVSNSGEGVGKWQGRVVFVADTVTGDRVSVRLVRVKPKYATGVILHLISPSPYRIRPRCLVADKCGGCQWQHISDEFQQEIKQNHVIEALKRIGNIESPPVASLLSFSAFAPLNYRNKSTYPFGVSATGQVKAGYYRRQSHQLINLNQCPVQDSRLDPLLAEVKQDIQAQGWSIYDEKTHQGQLRHLCLRIGRRTGEMFLTLVSREKSLKGLDKAAKIWYGRYPSLQGIALNFNPHKTNTIFGEKTEIIAGKSYFTEIFADIKFKIRPDTFFQINTEAAEALLGCILDRLTLHRTDKVIDAYCGVGTFSLPLAQRVSHVWGIEVNAASIEQAQQNAIDNEISNVTFSVGKVAECLPQLDCNPDLILLDPPRKGCDRAVIKTLCTLAPPQIVYISCQPTTLARDLKLLCEQGRYHLTFVQPVDFFPQTTHVECAAFLERV